MRLICMTTSDSTESDRAADAPRSGSLFADVRDGLTKKALDPVLRVVRDEIASARSEISSRVAGAKTGLVLTAVGAVLGLASVGLVVALIVALLALAFEPWAAIAITLGGFLILTAVLLALGVRGIKRGLPPVPADTIADVRETISSATS